MQAVASMSNALRKRLDPGTGDKVGSPLVIKPLTKCNAGELVRLDNDVWAIVANDSGAKRIFVISGDDAPVSFVPPKDKTDACLSHGTGFRVAPVRSSLVGIHTYGHEGFDPIGKLIVSRSLENDGHTNRYLAAPADQPLFLDLDNFEVVSEPHGHRVLFQDWEVSLNRWGREIVPVAKVAKSASQERSR
jgi:hypothetical protein